MDRDLLEQLAVPQPPYRMPRPTAVLAAAEEPAVASTEGEVLVQPSVPENLSLVEAIEQQEAAVEAAAEAEKEKVAAAPPVEGATAGENEQDKENRERATREVEAAAAQEAAEARKRYAILEDLEPPRTAEQKVADSALAEKLRAERDQGQAAVAGKEESIDELVARHEKEEQAKQPKQPKQPEKPESVNEKISRLAQEAQAKLNTFKDAKPEEVARAKEDVQEVQRRLEAAKRVEPGPTPVMSAEEADRKAAEAKAAGKPLDAGYYEDEAKRAREEAKRVIAGAKKQAADEKKKIKDDAKRAKEEVEQQARAAEDKAAEARNAGKPLEAGYQADEAKRIREGKGATPEAPALKVGDKTPYGEVVSVSPKGKAKIRYKAPAVGNATEDIGSKTVNMSETPEVKAAREAAEAGPPPRKFVILGSFKNLSDYFEQMKAQKAGGTADAGGPSLGEGKPVAGEIGGKEQAMPAEVRMSQEDFERLITEAKSQGAAEAQPKAPGRFTESLHDVDPLGIEQLEKSLKPSGLKRFWESTAWIWKDTLARGATFLEKRAKDMLAERDEKIKQIEAEAAAHAEKSWLGKGKWKYVPGGRTIIKPLIEGAVMGGYQGKLGWHRWRRESISADLQSYAAHRKAFEDAHLNAINNVVSQQEVVVGIAEQRERADAKRVKEYEAKLDKLEQGRSEAQQNFLEQTDFAQKKKYRDELRQILADINEATIIRDKHGQALAKSSEEAADLRTAQNLLLKKAGQQERPVAEERVRERLQLRAKRKVKESTVA